MRLDDLDQDVAMLRLAQELKDKHSSVDFLQNKNILHSQRSQTNLVFLRTSLMSLIHVIQQQSIRHSKAYVLRILMIYNTLTFGVKKALLLCMDKCGGGKNRSTEKSNKIDSETSSKISHAKCLKYYL